ncbi:MAG TPA: hypothetical protein VNA16_04595 [Abditibacteriaceae bacterium]|nr:hypothetical protein [Abditibacteriaceae bacterium]
MKRTTLLAIDDVSLPLKKNLCYYLSKPEVRPEPVLTPTAHNPQAPDTLASHFYGTVLYDGGKFRMWYYPCSFKTTAAIPEEGSLLWFEQNINLGPVCYAESDDGIHWEKPVLGQVEFKGSRDNNAIALSELPIEGVTLIKDEDDPDPQRRYKMVYNYMVPERFFSLRTATSPDGIVWSVGPELPLDSFAEQASFYKHDGLYIANTQAGSPFTRSEGGRERGRQGIAWVSPDFNDWLQESAESFVLPEPARPEDRGIAKPYEQVHLGVGASSFGNVLVGFYCVWHNQPKEGDWFGLGTTSGDLVLVVSNDGIAFREPVKGHVYLSRTDSPVTPSEGAYETVLCQANGILTVGDETRIYHGRWRNSQDPRHYYAEVALATLPRDRWGALGLFPDQAQGSVWSAPVTLPTSDVRLSLNADGVRGMKVEISDERFSLLPEYSGANAGTCAEADGLD